MKKIITFNISNSQDEMIKTLKEITGLSGTSELIRYCIFYTYDNQKTPEYIKLMQQRKSIPSTPRTMEEKVQDAVESMEAKKIAEKKKVELAGRAIAEKMYDTTILEDGNGLYTLKYTVYEKIGKRVEETQVEVPFYMLTVDTPDRQFIGGGKQEILDIVNNKQ